LTSILLTSDQATNTDIALKNTMAGLRRLVARGTLYDTTTLRSRNSSTRLRALIMIAVWPIVSRNVLCCSIEVSTMDDGGRVV
jgi:hypothetical protein